MIELEEVITF